MISGRSSPFRLNVWQSVKRHKRAKVVDLMGVFYKIVNKIRQMRIVQKLIVGYILLVCLPFALFGYLFYRQMFDNLLDQYMAGRQQLMEQAYSNLEIELAKIESNYSLFQNNANITDYLNGAYEADWEMVYNYRKEIDPTLCIVG